MAPEIRGVIHLAHPKVSWASPFSKLRSNLLEDVLGLEGDHTGLMFEFSDGVLELGLGDIFQNSFGPINYFRYDIFGGELHYLPYVFFNRSL